MKKALFGGAEPIMLEFKNEAELLSKMNSPFIIRFFGTSKNKEGESIVMEYAPNGTLYGFLEFLRKKNNESTFSWDKRYQMAQQISNIFEIITEKHTSSVPLLSGSIHDRGVSFHEVRNPNLIGSVTTRLVTEKDNNPMKQNKTVPQILGSNPDPVISNQEVLNPNLFDSNPKRLLTENLYAQIKEETEIERQIRLAQEKQQFLLQEKKKREEEQQENRKKEEEEKINKEKLLREEEEKKKKEDEKKIRRRRKKET